MKVNFEDTVKKIQELGNITIIEWGELKNNLNSDAIETVRVHDDNGIMLDIPVFDTIGYTNSELWVLISVIIAQALHRPIMPFPTTLGDDVNEARVSYPTDDYQK